MTNKDMEHTTIERGDNSMRRMIAKKDFWSRGTAKIGLMLFITLMFAALLTGALTGLQEAQATTAITSCADCHGNPPVDNNAGRDGATGRFPGSHNQHAAATPYNYGCEICHAFPNYTWYSHQGGNINVGATLRWKSGSGSVAGWGSYSKGSSFAVSNITTFGACNGTYCHSSGRADAAPFTAPNRTPQWGTVYDCTACHGGVSGSAFVMTNASHNRHVTDQSPVFGAAFNCDLCHSFTVIGTSTLAGPMATFHVNKQVDVAFNAFTSYSGASTYSGTATVGDAYGSCSNVYCHSDGNINNATPGAPALIPTWGNAWANNRCANCHGDGVNNSWPTYASGAPASATANSHAQHTGALGTVSSCQFCHFNTTQDGLNIVAGGGTHINKTEDVVFMATTVAGSYISTTGNKTCSSTVCHGANPSAAWGSNTTNHQCTKCHGLLITTNSFATSNSYYAAPGYLGTGTNIDGVVGTKNGGVSTDTHVGAHDTHLRALNTISAPLDCSDCHAVPTTPLGHILSQRPANFVWSSLATANGKLTPFYSVGNNSCSNVYCHGAYMPNMTTMSGGTDRSPVWSSGGYFAGGLVSTWNAGTGLSCKQCHMSPPTSSSHFSTMSVTFCATCHGHWGSFAGGQGGWLTQSLHINGQVEGGSCVGCHASTQTITKGSFIGSIRRAVQPEFMMTWSHKRASRTVTTNPGTATVNNEDCGVCHMEGSAQTGAADPAYHKDGYIQLRDPDTGTTIEMVTFVGWTAGGTSAGWYTSTGTALSTMGKFSRNMSSATIEPEAAAIQINLCLKCHDGNGAMSTLAQAPGGTAMRPFGSSPLHAGGWGTGVNNFSTWSNSNGLGNVVNVKQHLLTTNAAYHPVLGKANNSYVQSTRMSAPWNIAKINGTTTQWGLLMTCFDCHADAGASGVQNDTVVAHGGAVTLRAPIMVAGATAAANLCLNCHATTYASTSNNHGAGSAFGSGGSSPMNATTFSNCYYCHAYQVQAGNTTTGGNIGRPVRAENVHGVNDRSILTVGSLWASGHRPYAFIRNSLSSWKPLRGAGVVTGSAACSGTGGTCNNNMNNSTYTPGGVY